MAEFMPEHVYHIKDANVEAILSDCKHQEDEPFMQDRQIFVIIIRAMNFVTLIFNFSKMWATPKA